MSSKDVLSSTRWEMRWSMILWLFRPDLVHKLVEGQYTAEKAPAGRPHTGANDNDPCSDPMDRWPRKVRAKIRGGVQCTTKTP